VHPLELGDDLGTWTGIFSDYEILQPFPQLAREVFTMTPEELRDGHLKRLEGTVVPTGKVLGLAALGWQRDDVEDGGVYFGYSRDYGAGCTGGVGLDPGIIVGMPHEWPEQKLSYIGISTTGTVDAITASEFVRDIEILRS
jgi:hypothetical protein